MEIERVYNLWLKETVGNKEMQESLAQMKNDPKEIEDSFYKELSFGTGGLRGVIGVGTNRMNSYTVGKATQGLANYLKKHSETPSVAVAYDTRNMSKEFAEHAAAVLSMSGIKVYLGDTVKPTPMLSYYVRELKADMGIVITASHNPKIYNGYKVYGSDGGQITETAAEAIIREIRSVDIFRQVATTPFESALAGGLISYIPVELDQSYYRKVNDLIINKESAKENGGNLKILYTSIHGTGLIPVTTALKNGGFTNIFTVKDQESYDGSFPTVIYPNPEEREVFTLALEQAKTLCPNIIMGTDPDCDRIGILVRAGENYRNLTGNQVGILLTNYILESHKERGTLPENSAVIKTIVTTDLPKKICSDYGVEVVETLTGFKYIGELVEKWQETKEKTFLLGFEESYGYLAGDFVRDKDAVIAAVLIGDMALKYEIKGISLLSVLNKLYEKYGFYEEKLVSVEAAGSDGQGKIRETMEKIRRDYKTLFSGLGLRAFEDYSVSKTYDEDSQKTMEISLPKSNVVKFIFADDSWIVMRPSGTEPKMKIYYQAVGASEVESRKRLEELETAIGGLGL